MGKQSIIGFSHQDYGAGGVVYFPCALSSSIPNAVAADLQHVFKGAAGGTYKLKNSRLWVGNNTKTGTTTCGLYHNGASSALEHSFSELGDDTWYSDASEVTLAANDTIVYWASFPAGSIELRSAVIELLTLTGPTIYMMQASGDSTVNSDTDGYIMPGGSLTTLNGVESTQSFRVRAPGWFKSLQATLGIAPPSGTVTFTMVKNGVDTAMTVSVGVVPTAIDTTHRVRVASGDLISIHMTSDTLGGGTKLASVSFEVESDNDQSDLIANGGEVYVGATGTHYTQIFGGSIPNLDVGGDTDKKAKIPFATRIGRLRVRTSNTVTGTSTWTLRANGVATALTLTLTPGVSGWFETPIGLYADVLADDELDLIHEFSGLTASISTIGMTLNYEPERRRPRVSIAA